MKKFLTLLLFIFFLLGQSKIMDGQIIYNADFSTNGDGFPNHTSSSPPAPAPASINGGTSPNDWTLSYTTTPSTDGSDNIFSVSGGALFSDDWGGQGIFQSIAIDVSSINTVDISAMTTNVGANGNVFEYFYILDGGSRISAGNISSSNGDMLNYTISNLDVSTVNTLVVGFEFNENGADDGYSTASFQVSESTVTPSIQFTSTTSTFAENSGSVTVCAAITNPDASNATTVEVALASSGNTAINGTDYTMVTYPVTLTFPAASSTDQCVTFMITDDTDIEGSETIDLIIQNPTGNSATLGSNTAHTLTITDNDVAGCDSATDILITEFSPNPCGDLGSDSDYEFIEFYNNGTTAINLENWELGDNSEAFGSTDFTFPSASIPANSYFVVAVNATTYDGSNGLTLGTNLFDWNAALNNGGDNIILYNCAGAQVDLVQYTNTAPWPTCPNDGCYTIALPTTNYGLDNNVAANWEVDNSGGNNGSPGLANTTNPCPTTTVQFTSTTSTIAEDGGSIMICASITDPDASTATTVEVALAGTGNTATNGTDYTSITFPVTLTFPAGSSTDQCVTFTITDDALLESSETIDLILQNPAGGANAALGSNTAHTLTITDNDSATNPTVITDPTIIDPCACNLDGAGLANGTFTETVAVQGNAAGETWTVTALSSLSSGGAAPTGIAVGTTFTPNAIDNTIYESTFNHSDLAGYALTVERSSDNFQLMISNLCATPSVSFNPTIAAAYLTTDATITLGADITNGGTAATSSPTFSLDGINNITTIDFDPTTTNQATGVVSVGNYTVTTHYETDAMGSGSGGTVAVPAVPTNACPVEATANFAVTAPTTTTLSFEALPDCDNMTGATAGTTAAANTMYVHISNMMNADLSSPTTFTSSTGVVVAGFPAGTLNGPIQITGLTASDYGTILTLTANNNGNTTTVQVPVIICGFSVQNDGNGQTPNATTNGTFCEDQNGATAPGILVEAAPTTALSSGNNITSTYVYVLVDTDNANNIIAFNNTGLFSSPNVINGTNYSVYAFNVDNPDLANFETAIVPGTTAITDITGMGGSFASLCYSNCWNAAFSPECFICPTISALTATSPICSGTATTDLTATIANFFGTENHDENYDVEFVYTTTQATTAAAVYGLTSTIIGTEDVTAAGVTSVIEGTFTLPTVTTQTTYYIYARILDAATAVPDTDCRPFAEAQVVVNPLPVLTAQTPTICANENPYNLTSLQSSITSASGTFAYAVGATPVTDPTMYTATTGDVITVTFTDGTTGCMNTTTITFTVNPLPTLTAQTPTICASENPYNLTNLQSSITSASGTFAYAVGTNAVTDPTMYTATNGDVVTVTFTDGTTGCMNTTNITFTVNPTPILTAQTPTICVNENPYNLTSLQSSITSISGTFAYAVGANAITDPTMYTATNGDVVTVTFTDGTTGCMNTTNITFTVNPLPTAAIALSESALCSTSSGTNLTISGTPGAQVIYSIDGVNQPAITIEGDGSNDIAVNPAATTVYTLVSVTNTTTTCAQNLSDSVTLTITDVSCSGSFPWSGNN